MPAEIGAASLIELAARSIAAGGPAMLKELEEFELPESIEDQLLQAIGLDGQLGCLAAGCAWLPQSPCTRPPRGTSVGWVRCDSF